MLNHRQVGSNRAPQSRWSSSHRRTRRPVVIKATLRLAIGAAQPLSSSRTRATPVTIKLLLSRVPTTIHPCSTSSRKVPTTMAGIATRSELTLKRLRCWKLRTRSLSVYFGKVKSSSIRNWKRQRRSLRISVHYLSSYGPSSSTKLKIQMVFWRP